MKEKLKKHESSFFYKNKIKSLNISNSDLCRNDSQSLITLLSTRNCKVTSLNFCNNKINESDFIDLLDTLKTYLSRLYLNYQHILCKSNMPSMIQALELALNLTHIDLSHNNISDTGAIAIAKYLKHNNQVKSLNLRNNGIEYKGAHALANTLEKNHTLTHLNLEENHIGESGIKALAHSLEKSAKLSHLLLSIYSDDYFNIDVLEKITKKYINLSFSYISNKALGAKNLHFLSELLQHDLPLYSISLSYDNIRGDSMHKDVGFHILVESFSKNTYLKIFRIHNYKIDNTTIHALSLYLKDNDSLKVLDLDDCKIDKIKDIESIINSLSYNHHLNSCILGWGFGKSYYSIGNINVSILAQTISKNCSLSQLILKGCSLGDQSLEILADALKNNDTLTELNVVINNNHAAKALDKTLKQNLNIIKGCFENRKTNYDAAEKLANKILDGKSLSHTELLSLQERKAAVKELLSTYSEIFSSIVDSSLDFNPLLQGKFYFTDLDMMSSDQYYYEYTNLYSRFLLYLPTDIYRFLFALEMQLLEMLPKKMEILRVPLSNLDMAKIYGPQKEIEAMNTKKILLKDGNPILSLVNLLRQEYNGFLDKMLDIIYDVVAQIKPSGDYNELNIYPYITQLLLATSEQKESIEPTIINFSDIKTDIIGDD